MNRYQQVEHTQGLVQINHTNPPNTSRLLKDQAFYNFTT